MKKSNKKKNIIDNSDKLLTRAILPSILSMFIFVVLLCGTTYAWYCESVESGTSSIVAGNFSVEILIIDENSTLVPTSNNMAILDENKTYTVTIKKNGTLSTGYAILSINSNLYLVENIPNEGVVVTINTLSGDFNLGVVPYWGNNKPTINSLPQIITIGEGD